MTEAEWLTCADPHRIFEAILDWEGLTDRKQRLIDCACVRRVPNLLNVDGCRQAVEVAEQFADGYVCIEELREVQAAVLRERDLQVHLYVQQINLPEQSPDNSTPDSVAPNYAVLLSAAASVAWEFRSGANPLGHAADAIAWVSIDESRPRLGRIAKGPFRNEQREQVKILHDVVGNPFRPVAFDPAWRSSTAVGLADAIYADRAFDRLPILADALQDAGCEDAAVLGHCRGDGPHVRGCWVVDLVLGKE